MKIQAGSLGSDLIANGMEYVLQIEVAAYDLPDKYAHADVFAACEDLGLVVAREELGPIAWTHRTTIGYSYPPLGDGRSLGYLMNFYYKDTPAQDLRRSVAAARKL